MSDPHFQKNKKEAIRTPYIQTDDRTSRIATRTRYESENQGETKKTKTKIIIIENHNHLLQPALPPNDRRSDNKADLSKPLDGPH
jgi:hypothetical protein